MIPEPVRVHHNLTFADAVWRADRGSVAHGYLKLVNGLARVRSGQAGEPWTPELLREWERMLAVYQDRFAVERPAPRDE